MSDAGSIEQLMQSGWAFYRAGNRRAALRDFEAALSINPEHYDGLVGVSQTRLALNDLKQAGAAADELLRIAPDRAQSHRIKGEVLRRQRKLTPAETFVRESIRLDPDDALGFHYLAVIQFERKDYRGALKTIAQGRRLAPDYAVLAAQQALNLLYLKGPKAAEPYADEALRLGTDDSYVLTESARVALMRGRTAKARELLETVLRRDANDEDAISLYLLTDPHRYHLLRRHVQFPFWRKDHGLFGWLVWLLVWAALFAVIIVAAVGGRVPAFVVAVAYQLFWRAQYAGHRKRVQAHFAQPQLRPF
jgi:tetratricopeptide (TPR) repeat protein